MPAGAEVLAGGKGVHFRVWAPDHEKVDVLLYDPTERAFSLSPEPSSGYFSALFDEVSAGTLYRYRLSGDTFPDPASRFQPNGPHQPSQVIDPDTFEWTDPAWRGLGLRGQVLYEMHVGTFTPEGTWASAATKLEFLRDLGITVIEVMPVSDFPRKFRLGLRRRPSVRSDAYLRSAGRFPSFCQPAHTHSESVSFWTSSITTSGPPATTSDSFQNTTSAKSIRPTGEPRSTMIPDHSCPVRESFRSNAAYWIREFHLDGLRLDATQDIFRQFRANMSLATICHAARSAAGERRCSHCRERTAGHKAFAARRNRSATALIWCGTTTSPFCDGCTRRSKRGLLLRLQWQSARVYQLRQIRLSLSGTVVQVAAETARHCHLRIAARAVRHLYCRITTRLRTPAAGRRCHELTDPSTFRAITALTLLGPGTPMLFQGQEFAASAPFYYFADHTPDLSSQVSPGTHRVHVSIPQRRNRRNADRHVPRPGRPSHVREVQAQLDRSEKETRHIVQLHRDLLDLRREDPVFSAQRPGGS